MFDLVKNFPVGYTPTAQQKRVLKRVQTALNGDKKFVIICAPTGTGKSMISKSIGNCVPAPEPSWVELVQDNLIFKQTHTGEYMHADQSYETESFGSYVLTITKNLQNQYKELFEDTSILKGKSNYKSTIDPNIDVELESLIMPKKILDQHRAENKCPYHNARNETLVNKFSALNYKMFLSLPHHVRRRKAIICDEASELEEEIVKRFSITVDYNQLDRLGVTYSKLLTTNKKTVLNWITTLVQELADIRDELLAKKDKNQIQQSLKQKNKLLSVSRLYNSLITIHAHWFDSDFIVEKDSASVKLTPLKVNVLSDTVFSHGDKVVLMSATVVDHKSFAKALGITDYEYVEVGCEFDSELSPIFVSTKAKLNHKNLVKEMPKVINQIRKILDIHKFDKGVIHTHTNAITSMINGSIKHNRMLYRQVNATNEDILELHSKDNKPTVLVSPSLTYGVDLKDNLARFQIIVKLPYSPLGSKRVKALFEQDKRWYENKMLVNLIQACGRGTRSTADHCKTYILDGNVVRVLQTCKERLPKYFLDRFV